MVLVGAYIEPMQHVHLRTLSMPYGALVNAYVKTRYIITP